MKKNHSHYGGGATLVSPQKIFLKMKVTLFVVLFSAIQVFATGAYSQTKGFTLAKENTTLENVLKAIEDQSNYYFLYNGSLIDVSQKINVKLENQSLEATLQALLKDADVTYKIYNRQIVLSPAKTAADVQQSMEVKGNVSDASGAPLPGVTVIIKGTTTGTITDFDGNYVLSNVAEGSTLLFSFVGMKPQEVIVGNTSTIDVTLAEESIGIEEVVAIGYGTQKKVTLTGSIGSISSDKLTERPAANTTELMQGQVVGVVTRQASGLPGADGTSISIRGFGTPLVLVDGMRASMSHVDPNDIESISVLKDASAAIYGAEAGNGVVLITTKRGSNKKASINYHGTYSFTNLTYRPDKVNATQWAELMHESGQDVDAATPDHVSYDLDAKMLINNQTGDPYYGYDWTKSILRNWVPQQQHNLNASGGSEKIKYFVSLGMTDQESNFKSGDYDYNRYNIRSNIDAQINDNLSVALDFVYRQNKLDKANFTVGSMFVGLATANPSYPIIHEQDPSRATYSGFLERSPYFQTFKDYSGFIENRTNAIQGAFKVKYDFPMIKGLAATAKLAYEDVFFLNKNVLKPFEVWEYKTLPAEGEDPWILKGKLNTNRISIQNERELELMPTFGFEYNRQFGEHKFGALVLSETRTWKELKNGASRKDLLSFDAPYLSYASEIGMDSYEGITEKARTSFIGRVNYDYKGKYMFQATLRADASAEYPPEGRWGYFPSMSAGWRLSEESFIKDNFAAVDNLKLRASYGVLGKDEVSSFDYLTGYGISSGSYIIGNTPEQYIYSLGLANPNITWETMTIYNLGLDASFWNGLLGVEADVFYRLREDILAAPVEDVPSTFGASLPNTNLNSRDDRGFELMITHRNKIGKFKYDIASMVSWKRSKYVDWQQDVNEDDPDWVNRYKYEGNWTDRRWGYLSDGLFQNEDEIANYPIDQDGNNDENLNQGVLVGDIKYKDLNGDNFIDWHDQTVIGKSGTPNINFSLSLGAEYKGFRLSTLWTGQAHYSLEISGDLRAPFRNGSIPVVEHYENRSIIGVDGDGKQYITNPGAKLPPVNQIGITANNNKTSDFWAYDARFVRLKNINLSYTLPASLVNKGGVKGCTFYVTGTNLLTFSNLGIYKDSVDPEVSTNNTEGRNYPPVKTFTFGLKLTL